MLSVVLNVTVPLLVPDSSFVAPISIVPFPVPVVPERVIQVAVFETVHDVLDVTKTLTGEAVDGKVIP